MLRRSDALSEYTTDRSPDKFSTAMKRGSSDDRPHGKDRLLLTLRVSACTKTRSFPKASCTAQSWLRAELRASTEAKWLDRSRPTRWLESAATHSVSERAVGVDDSISYEHACHVVLSSLQVAY